MQNLTKPPIDDSIDLVSLLGQTDNYSGADVSALVRESSLIAARSLIMMEEDRMEDENQPDIKLLKTHFEQALLKIKASISDKDNKYYQKVSAKIN